MCFPLEECKYSNKVETNKNSMCLRTFSWHPSQKPVAVFMGTANTAAYMCLKLVHKTRTAWNLAINLWQTCHHDRSTTLVNG